jgi:hypothetical protein
MQSDNESIIVCNLIMNQLLCDSGSPKESYIDYSIEISKDFKRLFLF